MSFVFTFIFVATTISPATASATSVCFLPQSETSLPTFSVSPVVAFTTSPFVLRTPESTLMYDILPTNGSATVLNTSAESGASASSATSTMLPSLSSAAFGFRSVGAGRRREISFISISIPARVVEDTQVTGVIIPSFIPLWIPSISSFCVNASPEKNFSKSASSVSATASDTASTRPSIRYSILAATSAVGISVSTALPLSSYL